MDGGKLAKTQIETEERESGKEKGNGRETEGGKQKEKALQPPQEEAHRCLVPCRWNEELEEELPSEELPSEELPSEDGNNGADSPQFGDFHLENIGEGGGGSGDDARSMDLAAQADHFLAELPIDPSASRGAPTSQEQQSSGSIGGDSGGGGSDFPGFLQHHEVTNWESVFGEFQRRGMNKVMDAVQAQLSQEQVRVDRPPPHTHTHPITTTTTITHTPI
eukprot:SAG11_NODE_3403_length_2468_cov_3.115287_1_plen_220_part_00